MGTREGDHTTLWTRAGNRCAICADLVVREGQARPGAKVGREHRIRRDGGLALSPRFIDSYENLVLLCTQDSQVADEQSHAFPPSELERLKRDQEERTARIARAAGASADSVTLRIHTAMFMPSSLPYYFLKVSNESSQPIQLERIWFATEPVVHVHNPQRPVPSVIAPAELFHTWILTQEVPADPQVYHLARAEFDNGLVITSSPNTDVPPAGMVGGGGQPLTSLTDAVAALNHEAGRLIPKAWDVFISHASADKEEIVRPLAHALRHRGLRVWYDEFELQWGSTLRRAIDRGVGQSRFGIVVLSPAFFDRPWTNYELDSIVAQYMAGRQVILPLWHNVTLEDVRRFSPALAATLARSTQRATVDRLADEIAELVRAATDQPPEP